MQTFTRHAQLSLRRYTPVLIIAILGISLSVTAFLREHALEQEQLSTRFEQLAEERATLLQAGIDRTLEILYATGALFDASDAVTRSEFNAFLASLVDRHPELHGVEWLPRVTHEARASFEAQARAEGFTDFQILEVTDNHSLITAAQRPEYFPVFFIEPFDRNKAAHGVDSYSQGNNDEVMDSSRDSGAVLATEAFTLVQDTPDQPSIVIYHPIYNHSGPPPSTVAERREALLGFTVVLLQIQKLVEFTLQNVDLVGLDWMLVDENAAPDEQRILFQPSSTRTLSISAPPTHHFQGNMTTSFALTLPGRAWRMDFQAAPYFYAHYGSTRAWLILAIGLSLTAFLVLYTSSRVRHAQELEHLARHDHLTHLPNRALFAEHLQQVLAAAQRDQRQLAVLFLDLDRFKHVNDSLGHSAGDQMLEKMSARLSHSLRAGDTLARMGGDEFIILMENIHHERDAAQLAEKLIATLADPIEVNSMQLHLTVSIGISLYPQDAITAETLTSNADAAMYRAKAAGRNTYQFYTPELTRIAHDQVRLAGDLRGALGRNELELVYQPQLHLHNEQMFGVEALLRWRHGKLGMIMPERFIPLAEETGLIIPIGAWVLREACAQAKRWLDDGLPLERISVNLAGPQIHRGEIMETVRTVLAETGLPASKLELEVTESNIMGQTEALVVVLKNLRHIGVTISVDDFGTGYSSLSRLKRLPIDRLKIDRSFVCDLPFDEDDAAIARAVIALGRSLGLRVIAEGVENAEQAEFLRQEGCHEAQGYYYSKPISAAAVTDIFAGKVRLCRTS